MRKLSIIVAGIVGVLIVTVIALPFVLPLEAFKDDIATVVEDATDRSFSINGKLSLSLIPNVVFEMEGVKLGNADGFGDDDFVELASLKIQIATFPLLTGNVQVEKLVLDRPIINLAINANGQGNWVLSVPEQTTDQTPEQPSATPATNLAEAPPSNTTAGNVQAVSLPNVNLGDVQIIDALVRLTDYGTGTEQRIEHLNAKFMLANLSSPFSVESDFAWNDQKFNTTFALDSVDTLLNAQNTGVSFNLSSKSISADGSGDITLNLSGDVPSLLVKLTINSAAIHSDRIPTAKAIDGGKAVAAAKPAPLVKTASKDVARGPLFDLSKEALDLSGLKAANADVALSINHIGINDVKAGPLDLALTLKDGVLDLDLRKLGLYSGNVAAKVSVDGRSSKAKMAPALNVSGVRYHELLEDLGILVQVGAELSTDLNLKTSGASVFDLASALSGKGKVVIDKAGVIRVDPQTFLMNLAGDLGDKLGTLIKDESFDVLKEHNSRLEIPITLSKGVVSVTALELKGPLLHAQGKGSANIVHQSLDFHIVPLLVSSVTGAQQAKKERGVRLPFFVRGSFATPEILPDEKGLMREAAKQGVKAGLHYAIQKEMQRRFGAELPDNEFTNSLVEGVSEAVTSSGAEGSEGSSSETPVSDAVNSVTDSIKGLFSSAPKAGDVKQEDTGPLSNIKSLFGN